MDRFEANQIIKGLLNVGEEMMGSGAEMWRAEESMYRMLHAYGFLNVNVWLIASNIQVTVETEEGEIITQIRYVHLGEANFDRLDYLNNLSRKICEETPSAVEIQKGLDEVLNRPKQPLWLHYVGGILGGTGFAVFFNCNFMDAVVAAMASFIIVALGGIVGKTEHNPLRYNAILSAVVETFILFMVVILGIGQHHGNITVGVVMLLISGLGFTNGIRDMLNRDIISGIINLANSVLGAAGIAIGIALPILIAKGVL